LCDPGSAAGGCHPVDFRAEREGRSVQHPLLEAGQAPRRRGYIESRVSIVNRNKVGLPVTVFVSVRTVEHDEKWLERFAAAVMALPEVLEFHRMSGDVDYLLKVVTTDIGGYDRFYKKLIKTAQLAGVSSAFSMEQIKYTTALPLDLISHGLPA
jgi:Lrp/AsnC family transcriptional regulator